MAQTPLKNQAWKPVSAQISGLTRDSPRGRVNASLKVADLDLSSARIVWEAGGQEPAFGQNFQPTTGALPWVEAEGQLPDGRRVFGIWEGQGAKR